MTGDVSSIARRPGERGHRDESRRGTIAGGIVPKSPLGVKVKIGNSPLIARVEKGGMTKKGRQLLWTDSSGTARG